MTYKPRRELTNDELSQITTLYKYRVPTRTIGLAFDLGYQKINKIISVIKLTTKQHSPQKIREHLTYRSFEHVQGHRVDLGSDGVRRNF